MVAREVVGFEEHENSTAGLVADGGELLGSDGTGEQDGRSGGLGGNVFYAERAVRGDGRPHPDPPLAVAEIGVFEELKAKNAGVKRDGLVVVADRDGEERDVHGGVITVTFSSHGIAWVVMAQSRVLDADSV